jgi:hypothetical protein
MAAQVLMSQKQGPLPITTTFSPLSDATSFLELAGSVWTTTANQMIGIEVVIDGASVGAAQIFSNAASTHRAVVTAYFKVQLSHGSHTLTLKASSGSTTSDINDFFTVAIHY